MSLKCAADSARADPPTGIRASVWWKRTAESDLADCVPPLPNQQRWYLGGAAVRDNTQSDNAGKPDADHQGHPHRVDEKPMVEPEETTIEVEAEPKFEQHPGATGVVQAHGASMVMYGISLKASKAASRA